MHDTSNLSNNCSQTDYFTYNSLYHNSRGSEVDCAFKQLGKFQEKNDIMALEASDITSDSNFQTPERYHVHLNKQ